jgi:hypothetical protein
MSAVIYTGRIQGQTSAGAALATQNPVTLHADGNLRWTDAAGRRRVAAIRGDLAILIRDIFQGAGGLPATAGNRLIPFDAPRTSTAT